MDGIIQFIQDRSTIIIIIGVLLVIFLYVIYAVSLNKLLYNKTTWMAWVPIFNTFLLGKLAYHWIDGIIFVILSFLSVSVKITINGVEEYYSILPDNIREPLIIVYCSLIIITLIYAYIKYKRITYSNFSNSLNSKIIII